MSSLSNKSDHCQESPLRLRAVVEIVNGEMRVFPIADNDADEQRILDALRFLREGFEP